MKTDIREMRACRFCLVFARCVISRKAGLLVSIVFVVRYYGGFSCLGCPYFAFYEHLSSLRWCHHRFSSSVHQNQTGLPALGNIQDEV